MFGTASLFGQAKPAEAPAAAPSGGLFGSAKPAETSGGLFGSAKPAGDAPAPSGGLFGSAAQQAPNSLFGGGDNKPATGGFGSSAPSGSLFGSAQPPATGLFGNAAAAQPGTSLFGMSQSGQPSAFGAPSMFEKKEDGDKDGDDDKVEQPDEAPIYAEGGNDNVVFKKGVEIQKSPYTKVFEVSQF